MIAGLHSLGNFLGQQDRAHRQPTSNGLRECQHVGHNSGLLIRKQGPGTSKPALNFVEDERDTPLCRDGAQLAQQSSIDHTHATLALHRLQNQRGDRVLIQRGIELGEITLENGYARNEWPERNSVGRPVGGGQRSKKSTMKRATQGKNLMLRVAVQSRPTACKLERTLVRLCTRVAEENLVRK